MGETDTVSDARRGPGRGRGDLGGNSRALASQRGRAWLVRRPARQTHRQGAAASWQAARRWRAGYGQPHQPVHHARHPPDLVASPGAALVGQRALSGQQQVALDVAARPPALVGEVEMGQPVWDFLS